MKVESIKELKPTGFIWGILIGMSLELIITGAIFYKSFPHIWWTLWHPVEITWTIERYNTIQKASHVLFFEDEMQGVTIVKPQMNTLYGKEIQ